MPRAKESLGTCIISLKAWSRRYCEKKLLSHTSVKQPGKDLKSCTSIKLPNAGETRHSFKLHIVQRWKWCIFIGERCTWKYYLWTAAALKIIDSVNTQKAHQIWSDRRWTRTRIINYINRSLRLQTSQSAVNKLVGGYHPLRHYCRLSTVTFIYFPDIRGISGK
jgi:hypothetical protein